MLTRILIVLIIVLISFSTYDFQQKGAIKMGVISKQTVQKLFLLGIVEKFRDGVYGAKRLQKLTYFIEKDHNKKPFTFKKWRYGQFSEEIETVKEQLISMGHLVVIPLKTGDGNQYRMSGKSFFNGLNKVLETILPGIHNMIECVVNQIGYLPEKELLKFAYQDPLLKATRFGKDILKENLPEEGIRVPNLNDEDCEEIQLILNPEFTSSLLLIKEGMDNSKLDLDKVQRIGQII